MSGLGVTDWTAEEWAAFEAELVSRGYRVEHCAHCDRSNRHPSCYIVPPPIAALATANDASHADQAGEG